MQQLEVDNEARIKETKYVTMIIQNGIFHAYYKELEILDMNFAKVAVQDRLNFFQNIAYPCLFDITKVKETTKEARDYMANEGNELVLASAMVVNNPMLKMMANFYIMVNKPKNPTRLFTDRDSALDWLEQFKNKN
ncbi:hypothetical protein AHMF7605_03525 [Adhaeribacter arboris]|uniref:DUF7793 domain-containing protein n=1 Tax=Adhaeribacter arboris TaxID=2072846 RepID=A0A2T2YAX5_9BACT|nr:hypothetical protein [Adhaeribacter arboris]PSR52659.1 hypothetical protein AHMF7605_03525 [Adhaeribacter arboris]